MSQEERRKRISKGRPRALPSVKSDEGKAQTEIARQWVRCHRDMRAEIGNPRPNLFWTRDVPGYRKAHASAVEAAINIIAETGLIRDLAAVPPEKHAAIINHWRLKLGIGSPNEIIAELMRDEKPDQLVATLHEAAKDLYNAQRNAPPSPLFSVIARNPSVLIQGPREAVGEMATLIIGRTMSPMRASLPSLWIKCGLWLAEVPEAAAFLETRMKVIPELSTLVPPTEEMLRGWISTLCLFRYEGKGHLRFDQNGDARPDAVLKQELSSTRGFPWSL